MAAADAKRPKLGADSSVSSDGVALAALLDRLQRLLAAEDGTCGLDDVLEDLGRLKSAAHAPGHNETAWAAVYRAEATLQVSLLPPALRFSSWQ